MAPGTRIEKGHYYLWSLERVAVAYGLETIGKKNWYDWGADILVATQEMNGSWYSWGSGHTRPEVFVAAWRHVVSVFRRSGARNVRWLWTVNSTNATAAPL